MVSILHPKVSPVANNPARPNQVGGGHWNDEHDLTLSASARFMGRVSAGAGDVEELTAAQARSLLGIINGQVAAAGTITRGSGFTVAKPSAGVYNITFSTALAAIPIAVATLSPGPSLQALIDIINLATTGFTVQTYNNAGVADAGFTFIVMPV